jgi:histidinol phosphatase-like enzyme (inositol monophosphatase family)
VQFEKELQFARSVAMHAGDLALGYAQQELKPESKPDLSPVTIADKECERLIAARIEAAFPEDGILGEEGSDKPSRNGRRWIIDPIDGTRDFVRGIPVWSNLLALEADGEVVLGVCNMPARQESYFAWLGGGAYRCEQRISISGITDISLAAAFVNGGTSLNRFDWSPRLLDFMSRFWSVRSFGGCLDAMYLATGKGEFWLEPTAEAWDFAPLKIILEEAGARFFNLDGGSSIYGRSGIACVPALEPLAREFLGLR